MKTPKARKMSSGNYFIQLRLGGVSTTVTASTEKECVHMAQLVKAEYLVGKRTMAPAAKNTVTVTQAIDNYIRVRSNTLSPLTIRGYRIIQDHRFQHIMPRILSEIKPEEWQKIVNREAALCSPKTLRNAWGLIRSVVHEVTGSYPPEVKLPGLPANERPFLTPEEIKVFVAAVKDTHYAVPALLALSSLRVSEIEALDWKDIPENPEYIRVRGAIVLDENNKRVRKAQNKTAKSARNVPLMIPELKEALERERRPKGPVMRISQNGLRYGIKKICRENGLPDIGIHSLRHSCASLMYHLQIPEKIAMEIGGWTDSGTMHRIYTHIAQSDMTRYQKAMSSFYAFYFQENAQDANKNANSEAEDA